MSPTLVDLSHLVTDGMETYPGLPGPEVDAHLTHEASRAHYGQGTTFHIGRVRLVGNTGTYIDAPFHRFPEGGDVAELRLESVAGLDGVLVEAPDEAREGGRGIALERVRQLDVRGKAVLLETGWSRLWGTEAYVEGHPFLTGEAAAHLARAGAALVGIDSLNIDDTDDPLRPAHTELLGAGIPVVEHLRGLEALRGRSFRFWAVPPKIRGMGSFPVRAFAAVE